MHTYIQTSAQPFKKQLNANILVNKIIYQQQFDIENGTDADPRKTHGQYIDVTSKP
jgi:hypothetical protein